MADKKKPFDGLPFRVMQLLYAAIAASLLMPLYHRLGIPAILAVLGALLYTVHPIHTEVVAWLSARKDLISCIFIVLSFLAWLSAREATTPNQWRIGHALTIVLALLGVLSKSIAVILPALFIAYEFCSQSHVGFSAGAGLKGLGIRFLRARLRWQRSSWSLAMYLQRSSAISWQETVYTEGG